MRTSRRLYMTVARRVPLASPCPLASTQGVLVNVLVGPADDLEDLRQGVLEGVVLHLLLIAATQSGGQSDQLVQSVRLPRPGQGAAEVLAHHGHGAVEQVAQVAGPGPR